MTSLPHLMCLGPQYNLATKDFLIMAITMTLVAVILIHTLHETALVDELLPLLHALRPIHLIMATFLVATVTVYRICRHRTVYLVDYACFQPSSTCRAPKASCLETVRLSPFLDDSTVNFIARVLEHPGMGEETYVPISTHYLPPKCCLDEARDEAKLVIFSVIDDLLAKTSINLDAINVLITNCSIFCPVPSMADVIVNRYKLRGDLRVINFSGMGCSAGVIAVGLARNIMQVMPWGSHALVVSTEILGSNYYAGNRRSMQLVNILFRMGGTAILLSTSRSMARFRLMHVVRTTTAADDHAYQCVYQEEDDKGNLGTTLLKDLMTVAGDALKANITAIGPFVLPASELLKFIVFSTARKVLHWRRIKPYIPDFRMAFEHFCIHVGGPAVIDSVKHALNLSDEHVEPSRMTMHRFGNQSSSSIW